MLATIILVLVYLSSIVHTGTCHAREDVTRSSGKRSFEAWFDNCRDICLYWKLSFSNC